MIGSSSCPGEDLTLYSIGLSSMGCAWMSVSFAVASLSSRRVRLVCPLRPLNVARSG
jgi:hypothetical protein